MCRPWQPGHIVLHIAQYPDGSLAVPRQKMEVDLLFAGGWRQHLRDFSVSAYTSGANSMPKAAATMHNHENCAGHWRA
jgi:hypothetical protein